MIYTFKTIPAYLFFKIQETSDLTLLSDKKQTDEALLECWGNIVDTYGEIANKNYRKTIKLRAKIHGLEIKYLQLTTIITLLKKGKKANDKDIIQILKDYGYKFDESNIDLGNLERNINSIKIKIGRYKADLERLEPINDNKEPFNYEKSLMTMSVILEMGYIKSNEMLLCDFVNIVDLVEEKVKALDKINKK